jgi:hypothetical protein
VLQSVISLFLLLKPLGCEWSSWSIGTGSDLASLQEVVVNTHTKLKYRASKTIFMVLWFCDHCAIFK